MSTANTQSGAETNFRAVLTPHRSLSPTGFLIMMSLIGSVSFVMGIAFLSMGAWPVTGFFGLDVALIYYAFRANYRSGSAYETVEIGPSTVTITRFDPKGRSEQFEFNAYWARVHLDEDPCGSTRLNLVSHGRKFLFASFLSDDDRRDFARVLDSELHHRRTALPTA